MNEEQGLTLVASVYEALHAIDLDQCQIQLAQLAEYAEQMPTYADWHLYLTGVFKRQFYHDIAGAEAIFQALCQKALDVDLKGRVLNSLGITYRHQGRWRDALAIYQQGLDLLIEPDQLIQRAKIQRNMAAMLEIGYTHGDFGLEALHQADDYCQQVLLALQPLQADSGEPLLLEGTTWNTRGIIYRNFQQWPEAIAYFQRYLAIGHTLKSPYDIGMASNNLGEVWQLQGPGTWSEAEAAYHEARQAYQHSGDRYEEIDVLANLASLYEAMGQLEQALAYCADAITLIESLREGVSEEQARSGFFATMTAIYAYAVRLSVDLTQFDQAFYYVERARARAFLDLLAQDAPQLLAETQAEAVLSLPQVQASLPADTLLLAYFTMGVMDPQIQATPEDQGYRHRQPPARIYAFAITAENIAVFELSLSPNDILPGLLNQVVEKYFLTEERLRFFFETLLSPIKTLLTNKKQLYIVPHGPLHYIPFQALMTKTDDKPFLFDEAELHIAYAPSATILVKHCQLKTGHQPAPTLALGYNGSGTTELLHPEAEAVAVANLFQGHLLSGSQPKKEALFQLGENVQTLHIACHGHFKPKSPMASYLELGPNEQLTAQEVVDQLRLPPHSLVTMSACESGLSLVLRGDELMGLPRAFLVAGASTVLCTMWRVEEGSTRILMERFYHNLQAGHSLAEALKQAQQHLRQLTLAEAEALLAAPPTQNLRYPKPQVEGSLLPHFLTVDLDPATNIFDHPRYWAPFILIGGFETT